MLFIAHTSFPWNPSLFAYAFMHGGETAALPCELIKETVEALTLFFRTPEYFSKMSQSSLEFTLRETVHALLDERLSGIKGKSTEAGILVKPINKVSPLMTMYSEVHCMLQC